MRKRIISRHMQDVNATDKDRLDLENLAQVELTSEDEAHPFESALKHGRGSG